MINFHQFAAPSRFYALSQHIQPIISWLALVCFVTASLWALFYSPPDRFQGDSVRIMYWHVPAAFLSMGIYFMMAVSAVIALVWRIRLAFMVIHSAALIGAAFTFLALTSGAIWGKPTWGSWWVWDARLTSELVLLFVYLGLIGLHDAYGNRHDQGDRACAILTLVGVINLPIIHGSVLWWHTLHQPPSLSKFSKPSIDDSLLWPLLLMILAYALIFFSLLLYNLQNRIIEREQHSDWLKQQLATELS